MIGLIAAPLSSADSSLTSLTTSVSIDLWGIKTGEIGINHRKKNHIVMAFVLWLCIVLFHYVVKNESVIAQLLLFAGYTYGPLLGLFLLGIFFKFMYGKKIKMSNPLSDGIVTYADGTEATIEQMAADVTEFLAWSAEPEMEVRKRTGIAAVTFLLIMIILSYLAKQQIWANVKKKQA